MNYRTDLALERIDFEKIKREEKGYTTQESQYEQMKVTTIDVKSNAFAEKIGKPLGRYITMEVPSFSQWTLTDTGYITHIASHIAPLLPTEKAPVLVVGLGNTQITPDALGPKVANKVLPTRHLTKEIIKAAGLSPLRSVAVFSTNVLGKTGLESAEIVKSLCDALSPCAVIAVDALAAAEVSRLGTTIQIANTGISPGSGVANHRKALDEKTLKVPVISIGVPTVVSAHALAAQLDAPAQNLPEHLAQMVVTPREIDLLIERAANVVSLAINSALQPHISPEDMTYLVS